MEELIVKESKNNVVLENREKATVSGVSEVKKFDENEILLETSQGRLLITGKGMHVEKLSLEIGEIALSGTVDSFQYQSSSQREGSFWSKLF